MTDVMTTADPAADDIPTEPALVQVSSERLATEEHVQLRIAEDERVALVDQGQVEPVAQRLGQQRAELEAAEARTQDYHARFHAPSIGPTGALYQFCRLFLR